MKALQRNHLILLLILPVVFLAGCGRAAEDESPYKIYYLNKEVTKIVSKAYTPLAKPEDTAGMIEELMGQLAKDSGDVDFKKPIPDGVTVQKHVLEETLLTLYFSEGYSSMDKIEETLARAAIVRTMTQIEGVECLTFFVGESPLKDNEGNLAGVMANDSFVENPGEQINSIQEAALVLYFSNLAGDGLVAETKKVHYSSNISMEKLVMQHLLEGPENKDAQSALPEGTKLMNVSVSEGVCYVSLDENFRNQNHSIQEPIVMYSIINSLSEISTINKVQISVNGDTNGVYRSDFLLDELYERNLDYVEEP